MSHRAALALLLFVILAAHMVLWSSDKVEEAVKLRLTLINAIGWGIVLIPAWLVGKWAAAHRTSDPSRKADR